MQPECVIVFTVYDTHGIDDPAEHRLPISRRELQQMLMSDREQFERAYGREGLRVAQEYFNRTPRKGGQ